MSRNSSYIWEIGKRHNWKLSASERVRIEKGRSWKGSALESVKVGKRQITAHIDKCQTRLIPEKRGKGETNWFM